MNERFTYNLGASKTDFNDEMGDKFSVMTSHCGQCNIKIFNLPIPKNWSVGREVMGRAYHMVSIIGVNDPNT